MVLVTEKELIDLIKVSRMSIYSWRKKGLPYLKIGNTLRYESDEVIKWMKDNAKGIINE